MVCFDSLNGKGTKGDGGRSPHSLAAPQPSGDAHTNAAVVHQGPADQNLMHSGATAPPQMEMQQMHYHHYHHQPQQHTMAGTSVDMAQQQNAALYGGHMGVPNYMDPNADPNMMHMRGMFPPGAGMPLAGPMGMHNGQMMYPMPGMPGMGGDGGVNPYGMHQLGPDGMMFPAGAHGMLGFNPNYMRPSFPNMGQYSRQAPPGYHMAGDFLHHAGPHQQQYGQMRGAQGMPPQQMQQPWYPGMPYMGMDGQGGMNPMGGNEGMMPPPQQPRPHGGSFRKGNNNQRKKGSSGTAANSGTSWKKKKNKQANPNVGAAKGAASTAPGTPETAASAAKASGSADNAASSAKAPGPGPGDPVATTAPT